MTQNVTLLPPVGGINLKVPLANMDPVYSPWIQNFDTDGTKLSLRRGIRKHCELPADIDIGLSLGVYESALGTKLCCWALGTPAATGVYEVSTATPSLEVATSDSVPTILNSNYKGRLWYAGALNAAGTKIVYDGTSWTGDPFTFSAAAFSWQIVYGYKSRGYLFGQALNVGAVYYYTNTVGGVAGACSKVDLSSIFNNDVSMAFITSFSESDGVNNDTYIAFGTSAGEVAIYSGDYPGSANWRILAKFKIGRPLGLQPVIEYQNDAFILTEAGLVSLRNLFVSGENAAFTKNISEPINNTWIKLINSQAFSYFGSPAKKWSGAYWENQDKIIILTQGYIDVDGNYDYSLATFFVLDTNTQAWTTYTWDSGVDENVYQANNLIFYGDSLYFLCGSTVMKLSAASSVPFYDGYAMDSGNTNVVYPYKIHGAYQSNMAPNTNKKIEGFEILLRTDMSSSDFGMLCSSDFGRRISDRSKVDIQAQTTNSNGYNRVKYSVGTDGVFYQYRFEGTSSQSATYGMEVYSVITLFNPGGNR